MNGAPVVELQPAGVAVIERRQRQRQQDAERVVRSAVDPVATWKPPHAITSALDAAGIAREDEGGRLLERQAPRACAVPARRARHHLPEHGPAHKGPVNSREHRPASGAGIRHELRVNLPICLFQNARTVHRAAAIGRAPRRTAHYGFPDTCVSVETLSQVNGLIPRESAGPRVDSPWVHSLPGVLAGRVVLQAPPSWNLEFRTEKLEIRLAISDQQSAIAKQAERVRRRCEVSPPR